MAKRIKLNFVRTYASEANAERSVEKARIEDSARYIIVPVETEKGLRYGVLFIGNAAIEAEAHFLFNVVN